MHVCLWVRLFVNMKFMIYLQFACSIEAEVVGKPSSVFFNTALKDLGVAASEVSIIQEKPELIQVQIECITIIVVSVPVYSGFDDWR